MSPPILIVDDSLTVRMDLQETFESAGFAVTCAETAASAREVLARYDFSLIVLDVLLPDGDGVDLLREIKSRPAGPIPVILLSIEAEVRDRVRGLKTGADDYVGKPYDPAYLLARARQLAGRPGGRPSSAAPRLLLIDDSATFRAAFREVLERAGYAVVTAESGEAGLHMAEAIRPDAIIVDGILPGGMDGAAVVRRVKEDATLRHIPCVFLTASADRHDELRALEAGADTYVRKEADTEVILARLVAVLRPGGMPSGVDFTASSLLGTKRILAVDDSPTYLQELAEALRKEGYEVILAQSGEEALELLQAQHVDCILLDLLMPEMSGQETCRRIKGTPVWRNVPLLMLTALEERQAMIEGFNAGADDYIPKGSDFEVLRARLRAQLRRKQYEEENRRIREELLQKELEAAQARVAQGMAEVRAAMAGELERKNKELEAFSYSVSHDLRAPLRSINGFSQALLEDYGEQLAPKAREYLSRMQAATDRMGQLIDDLLELSRVSRAELHREPLDLSKLARAVAGELGRREPERHAEVAIAEGLAVHADPRLMRVALENLLANAWKFTARMLQARIELGSLSAGQDQVYFVRDNGVGFDMAYADKLFGPFQRLHAEADFAGTGIGLATVHRIIDRHGGKVWAEAAVDQGATFYFTLGSGSPGGAG
jgi:two-component system NtrC family sensor kinase